MKFLKIIGVYAVGLLGCIVAGGSIGYCTGKLIQNITDDKIVEMIE